MTRWVFLEDLQEAAFGSRCAPAAKRGHVMMWNDGLLRLTKKEQTNYPMVRWAEPQQERTSGDA
jgi:hypothetical protein